MLTTSKTDTPGTHDLGNGIYAYLQPPYLGFGLSNSGLIVGADGSIVVDTLMDVPHTEAMLASMSPITDDRPIISAINTHGDGDHWFGNCVLPAHVPIYASRNALKCMNEMAPCDLCRSVMTARSAKMSDEVKKYLDHMYAPADEFRFDGPTRLPNRLFEGRFQMDLGGRKIDVVDIGRAHSRSDSFVHVPDASAMFAGDLVMGKAFGAAKFSVRGMVAGLDQMLALEPEVVIPGHGPVVGLEDLRANKRYFARVLEHATECLAADIGVDEAADRFDLSEWSGWDSPEHLIFNLEVAYAELDRSRPRRPHMEVLSAGARFLDRHR